VNLLTRRQRQRPTEREGHLMALEEAEVRRQADVDRLSAERNDLLAERSGIAGGDLPLPARRAVEGDAAQRAASGLLPEDVDERAVLRGLFEIGLIAPGHKWQAKAEEETEEEPPATDETEQQAGGQ
jgi:hypothetical protein